MKEKKKTFIDQRGDAVFIYMDEWDRIIIDPHTDAIILGVDTAKEICDHLNELIKELENN
jgi:hypothetical protein